MIGWGEAMIRAYGISEVGAHHVREDMVCQDASRIVRIDDDKVVAAVADGVGSEMYSQIASDIAVRVTTDFCAGEISTVSDENVVIDIICRGFKKAQAAIEEKAKENNHDVHQYDTTLSVAVLIGDHLYYGHSGDSGIIAMTMDGRIVPVTEQQRDELGYVFPLAFGEDYWVFGSYDDPVASVLLATDGIYELFFPVYIKDEEISIYTRLARFFMDPKVLKTDEDSDEKIEEKIRKVLKSIPEEQVDDDKTVAVVLNDSAEIQYQPDEYYAEPDWKTLKENYDREWKKLAYPKMNEDTEKKGCKAE